VNSIADKIRIKSDSGYSVCSSNLNTSSADTDQKNTLTGSIQHDDHFKNPLEQIQLNLLSAVSKHQNFKAN